MIFAKTAAGGVEIQNHPRPGFRSLGDCGTPRFAALGLPESSSRIFLCRDIIVWPIGKGAVRMSIMYGRSICPSLCELTVKNSWHVWKYHRSSGIRNYKKPYIPKDSKKSPIIQSTRGITREPIQTHTPKVPAKEPQK